MSFRGNRRFGRNQKQENQFPMPEPAPFEPIDWAAKVKKLNIFFCFIV